MLCNIKLTMIMQVFNVTVKLNYLQARSNLLCNRQEDVVIK